MLITNSELLSNVEIVIKVLIEKLPSNNFVNVNNQLSIIISSVSVSLIIDFKMNYFTVVTIGQPTLLWKSCRNCQQKHQSFMELSASAKWIFFCSLL